jgi:hypothetical protein
VKKIISQPYSNINATNIKNTTNAPSASQTEHPHTLSTIRKSYGATTIHSQVI